MSHTNSNLNHTRPNDASELEYLRQIVSQLSIAQNNQVPNGNDNQFFNTNPNHQGNSNPNPEKPRDSYIRRLRSIPIFNGESYQQLCDFIDISESLYNSQINSAEEYEFFEQLHLQIRGEARNTIKTTKMDDWFKIKTTLQKHFNYLANKDIITSKLENLQQEKDETISAYADRARKLLREKNILKDVNSDLTEDQKKEHNRTARRGFTRGISNTKLRDRLTTRGASSLEDAIAYAIEAENDSLNQIASAELFCKFCKVTGHREKDCFKKTTGDLSQMIAALKSNLQNNIKNNNQSGFNNNFQRFNNNSQNRSFQNNTSNNNWSNNNNWNNNFPRNNNSNWSGNNNNWNNNNVRNNNNNNNAITNNGQFNRNQNGPNLPRNTNMPSRFVQNRLPNQRQNFNHASQNNICLETDFSPVSTQSNSQNFPASTNRIDRVSTNEANEYISYEEEN